MNFQESVAHYLEGKTMNATTSKLTNPDHPHFVTIYEDNADGVYLHRLGATHAVMVYETGDALSDIRLWDEWAGDVDDGDTTPVATIQAKVIGVYRPQDDTIITDGYASPGSGGLNYLSGGS